MNFREYISLSVLLLIFLSCKGQNADTQVSTNALQMNTQVEQKIIPAAENLHHYYPLIDGQNVALVVNQTSRIGDKHLVDSLLNMHVNVTKLFAPEHGIRGKADAGEKVKSGIDPVTNLPIISLYGKHKKPTKHDLAGVDVVVFDIQDVGVRFYTYISTLHYVMEACAEQNIPIIVLDRPNPNGHYVDGPVLKKELTSFVGMHPVPVVYGMTIGEYAQMINGEGWMKNGIKADLKVVKCKNYTHDSFYDLPIKPSPNLPNIRSIYLYPSLCFFEGTTVSVGRGTTTQFQVLGHPKADGGYTFTPVKRPGAKYPKHENKECKGIDLSHRTTGSLKDAKRLDLSYLISLHNDLNNKGISFWNKNNFFDKLAGTYDLRKQIKSGMSEEQIRATWQQDLNAFDKIRSKYLLYN